MKITALAVLSMIVATIASAAEPVEQTLDELKWVARPIIIFADSPADPRLKRQLAELEEGMDELEERDVVILVDTDPGTRSELRTRFRPRDFNVLLLGKDGEVKYRKPDPITVREITRLIDRMPLRQQELQGERG